MDSLAPAALLPPTLASPEVLGPPQTRDRLLVPEGRGQAGGGGIEDASRTRLCTCLGYCASQKNGRQPLPRGTRLTFPLADSWKSLGMSVLGTPVLLRNLLC